MTWILFLGLFPMAFFWLRRAWRILIRHDHSEVALKGGEPPPNRSAMHPGRPAQPGGRRRGGAGDSWA